MKKGCVIMRWVFTLPNSKEIRTLIDSEDDNKALLEEIIEAYKLIGRHFGDDEEDIEMCIESVQEDIELEAFDDESVNYHLNDFYDYCDERKVWIHEGVTDA